MRCDWITINFPLRTAFAASYRFWVFVFLLSFESMYFFLFPLRFLQWSLGYSVACCLGAMHFSYSYFFLWLISDLIELWSEKVLDIILIFLNFRGLIDVIYLGEYFMCTWEESVFCCFGGEISKFVICSL